MKKNINKWPARILSKLRINNLNGADVQIYSDMPNNIYETLQNTALVYPDKIALSEEGREVSFSQFLTEVDGFASSLGRIGVKKGDIVALLMTNSISFCIAVYANARLGAISLPISSKFKSSELQFPLMDSGAEVLICDNRWWGNVNPIINSLKIRTVIFTDEIKDTGKNGINTYLMDDLTAEEQLTENPKCDVGPADTALIMYTSGTTGRPKGAVISNYNLLHAIITYKEIFDITDRDKTIISIPIFHITGFCALMALFVYAGGTSYLLPFFDARKTLDLVKEKQITFFHASPTVYILLLKESESMREFRSVKRCAAGSSNMPEDVLRTLYEKLPNMSFHSVYGLTETSSPATIMPVNVHSSGKSTSCGIAIPGVRLRITDEAGRDCAPMEIGELQVRGTVVIKEYFNNAYANKNSFECGWFKTGDLACLDEDNYLFIVDRKKDMINRGGEKIYSIEVENILYTHEDVLEVAVVGKPDVVYGEKVAAVVILKDGSSTSEEDLIAFCKKKLSSYKVPREIVFVKELPHTASGKISKRLVREQLIGNKG